MDPNASKPDTGPSPAAADCHPQGLRTLFFTEMWERFSYYGMRALLVLFMVDEVRKGGMGLTDEVATSIYGLYTAMVYLAAVPGGWVADRILGARRSVWYGGMVIACGHFLLALPWTQCFFLGLVLLVVGTGMLKPNVSAMVGELYPARGPRRDAGFTLFYMGINLGAALGPLVCSALGERVDWHFGFAAAGVGMVLGLIYFRLTAFRLGGAGLKANPDEKVAAKDRRTLVAAAVCIALVLLLTGIGIIRIDAIALAKAATLIIVGIALLYFVFLLCFSSLESADKRRIGVIAVLFMASAIFWSGFEQAGSSLNLFAERYTERNIFNQIIPAGWFQALGPIFIISLAPVVAAGWTALSRWNINPAVTVKFAIGLLLLSAGFLVMGLASRLVVGGHSAGPTWLMATYLFHSVGELCLSPVGLSAVTKLAPRQLVGQMLGLWFLATSLGNLIAGRLAGSFRSETLNQMPDRFFQIVWITSVTGGVLFLLSGPIQRFANRDEMKTVE